MSGVFAASSIIVSHDAWSDPLPRRWTDMVCCVLTTAGGGVSVFVGFDGYLGSDWLASKYLRVRSLVERVSNICDLVFL